jgi:methionyl-tRNA formyltransferase
MNEPYRIVVATPHTRYDGLEAALRERLGYGVLRIREPADLDIATLREFAPSHVFFPHWSWKIPPEIHDGFECVIFHMTDVPFGRGGSPLQNLIVRGIETTRLSALRATAAMDAGPVYQKRPLSTLGSAEEVFLRAAELMLPMIISIVEQQLQPVPQSGEVFLFERRTAQQSNLAHVTDLARLYDHIRMLDAQGYPPAFFEIGPFKLEFSRAQRCHDHVSADVRVTLMTQEPQE